jgi:hypothetical protein
VATIEILVRRLRRDPAADVVGLLEELLVDAAGALEWPAGAPSGPAINGE